ncbi:recombinase family protein [Alkalihalophilus pseudofirmus]|uniref:recombinase family protein n=1 Tax=Alkalihalophilus pseudofirmus TaxID=79885 RepID=UPI00259BD294|nr:recombinase family protein [Alkalihalophilus pseudofirmus]WEG18461.1 recombinase family protein [Alkalihalophilus pseudofirmus]
MNIEDVKHIAIYLRISDDKKTSTGKRVENEETLANHREKLVEIAKQKGYTYEIFQEVVTGGHSEIENRPQLQSLLSRIEEFDAISAMELSRLSRNGKISELVMEYCIDYRVFILISDTAIYNLSNEMDALMFRLGSAFSAHERQVIGKRIKNNKIQMTKMGLNASGSVPLGYKRNPETKKLEIDEDAAMIVKYAFQLCQDGYGASKISQALNNLNYKTAKGNRFSTRAVKEMLKIQTYKGNTVYHDYIKVKRKGVVKREIVDTYVIENTHPAIIEPHIFDSVQEERDKRRERYSGGRERDSKKSPPSILKDLIYCKHCGGKMRVSYEHSKKEHLIRKCVKDLAQKDSECVNTGYKSIYVESSLMKNLVGKINKLKSEIDNLSRGNVDQLSEDNSRLKKFIEKQIQILNDEMKGLLKLELKYEMQGMTEIQEEFLKEERQKNLDAKKDLELKLAEIESKIEQPSVKEEINHREDTLKVIEAILSSDLSNQQEAEAVNRYLKMIIKRINYSRVLPEDIAKLGVKNPKRKNYPAEVEIEYF